MNESYYSIIGKVLASYPDLPELTEAERAMYEAWMKDENHARMFAAMVDAQAREADVREYMALEITDETRQRYHANINGSEEHGKRYRINGWFTYLAAACLLAIVSTVAYKYIVSHNQRDNVQAPQVAKLDDLKPGSYKAKLQLDNGQVVLLDSSGNMQTIQEGTTSVTNKDGQLVYKKAGEETKEMYNTLSTQKGETYVTTLSDGTRVWLNSSSSIRYPVSFVSNTRRVEITGEAYFEVASAYATAQSAVGAKRPFIVSTKDVDVEVLGTHFNVNGYGDDGVVRTALLEGKVKIQTKSNDAALILLPGKAADYDVQAKILKPAKNVDVEAAAAWHLGSFAFEDADVATIIKQLCRWYDIDVVEYRGKGPTRSFTGEIERGKNLQEVITILASNDIHLKLEGRKLIVMP